ncbi:MAG: YbdK family carboxylate-amine ligase, partial [Thermodesulfobacteriota bacterium]
MSIKFNDSKDYTLGVELEMQVVSSESLSLVNRSADILNRAAEDELLSGFVKHELMDSNIEVITKICRDVEDAEADLTRKLRRVMEYASREGLAVSGGGTHPFSLWRDQSITDDERYQRLLKNLQHVARRFSIFGLHVHVGIDGAEKCIYVVNRMLYYLPHLLSLSANSPFWEGVDTGLKSFRTKVFESLPTAGLPFYFKHWDDYCKLVENYLKTGTIETIR